MEMEESTRVVSLADVERIREQERAMAAAAPEAAAAPASANPWEDEPTKAAPARPAAAPWFVMVKSKQEGPLDEAGLQGLMESGAINARSFFWQQGMADWKRGSDIPELANLFAPPAAPPEPPPPALPPEPATVAARGQRTNTPAPQQEENAWDDVPTTVGQAPAAREPWDLDPPAAAQQQRQQAQWEEPPQEDQPAWDGQQAQGQDEQQQWEGQQAQGQDDQPAWDEQQAQGQEDQPAWDEPAPEQPRAQKQPRSNGAASKAGVGDDLFSDLDLPDKNEPPPDSESPLAAVGESPDPLASVRGSKPDTKKPVEDTRYFMKKSGVTRRNPAWKVALFIMLPILLIGGGVFALDTLNFVPKMKTVDAQGKPVEKSWLFSGEGRSELKDLLLGNKKPASPAPTPAPTPTAPEKKPAQGSTAPKPGGSAEEKPATPETGKSAEELQQLLGDASKTDVAPAVRQDAEVAAKDAAGSGGPPAEDVMKVVEKTQGAFQGCVETELRKNPKFKGGKVTLVTTVGTSGVVKDTKLDRKELDTSPVGDCIKKSAKRMVFPKFTLDDGTEEVELQIPLVLTSGAM